MKYGTESRSPVTINHLTTMDKNLLVSRNTYTCNNKQKVQKEVYMVAPEVTQVAYLVGYWPLVQ